MKLPLSASDLHAIADALAPIETNPTFAENPVIGRIEVVRPDADDPSDVVGWFVRDPLDGAPWFGFTANPDTI